MEEDSAINGNFYAPEVGKINQVLILTDPVRGMTEYKTQKEQKVQYQMLVAPVENGKTGEPKIWGVKAKSAYQQLVAIVKTNRVNSLVGATLQIVVTMKASNAGSSFREYSILPVAMATEQSIALAAKQYPLEKLHEIAPKVVDEIKARRSRQMATAPAQAQQNAQPVGVTQ
jgi:hypothetical protein